VVGHHIPTRLYEIAKHDSTIRVAGDVPDVRPFYAQAKLCIVPLLTGEGTRLKILEAFAMGVPVVSTSIGCEGLNVKDGETLLVADTPDAFAESVLRLFRNRMLALTLTKNARALTEAQYDWKIIVSNFQAELMQLAVDL
jgi:glycosyltransferase involved in cell wall biosynthesis